MVGFGGELAVEAEEALLVGGEGLFVRVSVEAGVKEGLRGRCGRLLTATSTLFFLWGLRAIVRVLDVSVRML